MNRPPIPHRCRGFSLVELMVSLVITLFLAAVLIQVFTTNRLAFRSQSGANQLQENGRIAMEFLGHSLRMADHWGGVEASLVSPASGLSLTGPGGCNQTWITDIGYGLQGFEGASNIGSVAHLPSACIAAAHYVPGSDLIVARYSEPGGVGASSPYLRSVLGEGGILGQASALGVLSNYGLPAAEGTANYPYRLELWWIRPCSLQAGGSDNSACDLADDGGSPIPTLTRLALDGGVLREEPLVEGVENLQLEYGRDSDRDGSVDRFDTASHLDAILNSNARREAWAQVISVRVAILVRSPEPDTTLSDTATRFLVGDQGAGSSGYGIDAAGRHHLRKQYTETFQVRNRTRS